jgi:SAM-dependent methyltransferase
MTPSHPPRCQGPDDSLDSKSSGQSRGDRTAADAPSGESSAIAGFPEDCYEQVEEVAAKNFWFRSRNRLIVWALRAYFPSAENFLEIGCGGGFVLSEIRDHFPELTIYGSEVLSLGLSFARERLPEVELFQMDARNITFRQAFDVIGAFDVLEHIAEDREALEQIYQATKPGGGIILTVPQHPALWGDIDDYCYHQRRYTRKELLEKVEGAGFTVLKTTSFVSFLLPVMFLSRLKQRMLKESVDPISELRLGPLLDSALERFMGIERAFIKTGVSFPAGGSLLLLARRFNN